MRERTFTTEDEQRATVRHGSRSGRFRRGLHHVTPQVVNQASRMEVQNQADADAAHAEIGVQLRFVHRQDHSDGFDLQDDLASHNDIGLESLADRK